MESIRIWSDIAFKCNNEQKIAFRALIADFVLQYMNELKFMDTNISTNTSCYLRTWKMELMNLQRLDERYRNEQVIMFLTGPGGLGKSHLVKNILEYAKQFCELLDHPFSSHTIVLMALTGVAATSIVNERVHSTLGLRVDGGNEFKNGKRTWNQ